MLSTEQILCHPQAFGLTTATPLQRAICRSLDGLPLGELGGCDDVLDGFGNVETLSFTPPKEVHILGSIRSAKSLILAAKGIQLSQTVRVEHVGRGDIVRLGVVSLKQELTRAVMSHLVINGTAKPLLRPLFVGEPTLDGAVLLHPSGRHIEVTPQPLDRAGGSLASTWLAGVLVDEEPRMIGAEGGVKNWDHMRDTALGRILEGGQFLGGGAPHAPFGPIFDLVQEHWGRPSADMVIVRARGPQMNPGWWTPDRCADLRRRNPTAYRTDVLCEFADPETALISSAELDAVTRSAPSELPYERDNIYVGAIDPATRRNAFTLVLITFDPKVQPRRYRVVLCRQWMARGTPLSPGAVFVDVRRAIEPFGVRRLTSDQFSVDAMRDLARHAGLELEEFTITAERKLDMFEGLRTLITSQQIELNPDPILRGDLLGVRKRVTQAGVAIHLQTTGDGRHSDYAAACALAVDRAAAMRTTPQTQCPPCEPHTGDVGGFFDELYRSPF